MSANVEYQRKALKAEQPKLLPCTARHPFPDCFTIAEADRCQNCKDTLEDLDVTNKKLAAELPLLERAEREMWENITP
jgi:hypothetical protein